MVRRTMTAHVVIIGGGFGGLYAARRLARQPVRITIVDRQNHHLFQPLLYQVATAGLSPADIATPIRALVEEFPNVSVHMGDVVSVDLKFKKVHLADATLSYDHVIIATGVRHGYFGRDEWEALAPGLKTIDDALEIRRRVLSAFEHAEREEDPARRAQWLTFVVVGGGPTGVELAGAISELARFTVEGEFRAFDPHKTRVVLIEAGQRVLAAFAESLSEKALWGLKKLGVEVRLGARVTGITTEGVQLGDELLRARTVLWGAGVSGSPLAKTLGVELDRSGRVKVDPNLNIPGFKDAWVVGDLACFTGEDGQALPGLAPVAIQQGEHVADNIAATVDGRASRAFHYFDKGIMATVGRAAGVAQTGKLKLSGFLGWLAWLFIHIMYLIGFRNRLLVMVQWAWAWFTYGRGARLITGMTAPPTVAPVPASAPSNETSRS
jgi:NADH dehydrogenase